MIRLGLRNIMLILLVVFVFVPLVKVAVAKVKLPDAVSSWMMSV